MAPKLDLFPSRCPACNTTFYEESTCPQIFRQSKQIYSETIPIFYSMNTFHLKCRDCDNFRYLEGWNCPVEPHDKSAAHLNSSHRYVKSVAIVHSIGLYHEGARVFSAEWLRTEHEILTRFKNTEHVFLEVPSYCTSSMTFHLVHRSLKSKTERPHGYDGVLAQDSVNERYGSFFLSVFEETCKTVLQFHHPQEESEDTVFVVESMR